MAELLKERSELDPQFMWDLSTLYKDDADWENALASLDELISNAASHAGKLKDAAAIRAYFDDATALEQAESNVFCYASLRKSEDTRGEAAQVLFAKAQAKYVEAVSATAYAQPEMLSLPAETLEEIARDPLLAPYAFSMKRILDEKPHTLSIEAETLLAGFGEVFAAPEQIAENLEDADLTFAAVKDGNGEETEVTGSNYILLQTSPDRTLRENAFRSYYASYKGHINTFSATYAGAVKAATAEAAARRYASSREMSMAAEGVPAGVYDNLVSAVRKWMPAMYKYVALRKKMLGVDELHYYDLYTPLVSSSSKSYTYEEAQKMVLSAVSPLGENYVSVVESAFANRWIDVYPNKGKRGGAFSSGTYSSYPYILTNFTGTLDSVSTIAHEMGHSLHTWHSNKNQPPQYADYTLFVAEVASTVNENLLVEQLLAEATDPAEIMSYLNQYMEGFKGTVYRQTMFAEFEREAHAMAERGEALTPASLCGLYRKLIEDYFGSDMVIDDEVQYEWARIPHFYRPFYVYKYATSYCASCAISEAVLSGEPGAVDRYLEFLSMGGSTYPLEELAHAGVDLSTPAPIEKALAKFESIVDRANALYTDVLAKKD